MGFGVDGSPDFLWIDRNFWRRVNWSIKESEASRKFLQQCQQSASFTQKTSKADFTNKPNGKVSTGYELSICPPSDNHGQRSKTSPRPMSNWSWYRQASQANKSPSFSSEVSKLSSDRYPIDRAREEKRALPIQQADHGWPIRLPNLHVEHPDREVQQRLLGALPGEKLPRVVSSESKDYLGGVILEPRKQIFGYDMLETELTTVREALENPELDSKKLEKIGGTLIAVRNDIESYLDYIRTKQGRSRWRRTFKATFIHDTPDAYHDRLAMGHWKDLRHETERLQQDLSVRLRKNQVKNQVLCPTESATVTPESATVTPETTSRLPRLKRALVTIFSLSKPSSVRK